MLFCRRRELQRGFSVLEVLIVLAVMSLLAALAATVDRTPSRTLQVEKLSAEFKAQAALARTRAVREGEQRDFDLSPYLCEDAPASITFWTDGTSSEGTACFEVDGLRTRLEIDPITGQFGDMNAR